MPYYGFYFDPTYLLVLIGVVLCMIASARVKTTYKKYEKVGSRSGYTADQVAYMILRNAGITDVSIHHISGDLTDNYNPKEHTLNLSDSVYGSRSIAAIGGQPMSADMPYSMQMHMHRSPSGQPSFQRQI